MALLTAERLTKRYGAEKVLEGVSLTIARGDRIALIGPNGCGKSTLLKVLVGQEEPTDGRLHRARGVRIGYLAQEPQLQGGRTLLEEMLEARREIRELQEALRDLEQKMAEDAQDELLHRYDELLERYRALGGYEYESEVHKVLAGLGFSPDDEQKPVEHLSGGQRARAALAKLLLEEPDLLLLDEPTNHLDLQALEWLEEYLQQWKGGFVIASHDRFLIDKLARRIWELEAGRLTEYPGNYSKYLQIKRERIEHQRKRYEEQQKLIQRTEEFIRKNIAGGRFREAQAKARRKMLERLERVEPPRTTKTIHFTIPVESPSGREVLKLKDLVVGYPPDRVLFRIPGEVLVQRGERVALIGPNGTGKTTLLRVLTGEIPPLGGEFRLGHNVRIGYYRQIHWEALDGRLTVLQALMDEKHQTISEARDFLGQFLFSGDDVYKRIDELSGGERSRVALAQLAQLGGNFLLLDEPTNHLDIASREVLQEALRKYEGTILFVSHDRYLIQELATQVWEVREGVCRIYRGNYEHYRRRRAEEEAAKRADSSSAGSGRSGSKPSGRAHDKRGAKRSRPGARARPEEAEERERAKRLKELQAREAQITDALAALEENLKGLERELEEASYAGDAERIRRLSEAHRDAQRELEARYREWHEIAEELERLGDPSPSPSPSD